MQAAIVKSVMKTLQDLFWNRRRPQAAPQYRQLELNLPGSRLTRDEASFLVEIRRLRDELAARAPR